MTTLIEQKTAVTVERIAVHEQDVVSITLNPVRTGPNGDSYVSVEMWLSPGEARLLRDDLARILTIPPCRRGCGK